jgi:predicted alpha-1,2-mannosidase
VRRRLAAYLVAAGLPCSAVAAEHDPVSVVDPLIGTARKDQTIGAANSGQTFPAVGPPFAMTHWTPQTQDGETKCIAPYYHQDDRIQGFRGTHWWSGSCTQDYGSVTVMPVTGRLEVRPDARAQAFRHADEQARPDLYSVTLAGSGVRADVTATARSGLLRFTFPRSERVFILVHPNSRKGEGEARVLASRGEIVGCNPVFRIYQGWGKPAGFSGCFVASFDRPFVTHGVWSGDRIEEGRDSQAGAEGQPGAYVGFDVRAGEAVQVRVATSFTSVDGARRNLTREIPAFDFDAVRERLRRDWRAALGRVEIAGATEAQRTIFYTALYHALLMPRTASDVDGAYPGFADDPEVRVAKGFTYYDDFSLWDTFRAQHPLLVLVQPQERTRDMVLSLLAKAREGGWLPIFPGWGSYTAAMIGDHAIAMIADAHVKGVRGFDLEQAYAAMRRNAFESPASSEEYADGKGRRALPSYLKHGFVPLEDEVREAFHKREQVSRTLEYAYDDFALARVARALGRAEDEAALLRRGLSYRSVIDPAVGFARGRHSDGRWVEDFDPAKEQSWITEGTPWQYTFFVPHDVRGLIGLLGGREAFVAKLDRLFDEGRYWHGNEPSHHIAYLYDHAGAPWKTQQRVRKVLETEYGLGPAGIKGNDDTGQMSAWYVWSALGLYPVCPGSPHYELGSPLFEAAVIRLDGGRVFEIRAEGNSAANPYVQSAALDERPHDRPWLSHEAVARGGRLVLRMGPRPNLAWGAAPAAAPPSLTPPD